MTRLAAVLPCLALAAALAPVSAEPPADAARVADLVKQLGSPAYADRQAAEKDLAALGEPALEALTAAAKSANPEQARRADHLARLIARRVESRKTLTPTLVEIDVSGATVDAVLKDLSKQLNQDAPVLVGGPGAAALMAKPVTLKTGRVPFWQAVNAVCDAAGLQINSAGGFTAPGAQPYHPPQGASAGRAVVLAARTGPARPRVVYGAVCVEAFPVPGVAVKPRDPDDEDDAPPTTSGLVLQAWPEPRLTWQAVREVSVDVVKDDRGQRLFAEAVTAPPQQADMPDFRVRGGRAGGRIVVMGGPGGAARFVEEYAPGIDDPGTFHPNARQALLRLKPGAKSTAALAELGGSLFGQVRSGMEAVAEVTGLTPGTRATAAGKGGVQVRAVIHKDMTGQFTAEVELTFEPAAVQPAGVGDRLPGGETVGTGNNTYQGVRVTDADGKAYFATPIAVEHRFDPTGRRMTQSMRLRLRATREEQAPPTAVTFWGNYGKSVEVPFDLRDVPVSAGIAVPRPQPAFPIP